MAVSFDRRGKTGGGGTAGENLTGRPGADHDDIEIRHDYAAVSSRLA